jgi:hypothetical protein
LSGITLEEKMKKFSIGTLAVLIAVLLSGCSLSTFMPKSYTLKARVLDLTTGDTGSVNFTWDGTGGGDAWGTINGMSCKGDYSTLNQPDWGSIYRWGTSGFAGAPSSYEPSEQYRSSITGFGGGIQVGSATLVCQDKNIVMCEYVDNPQMGGHGQGYCTDKKKGRYRFSY